MSVYVILQGGLGNQMFQLAMGTIVAKQVATSLHLVDDLLLRHRVGVTPRVFELHAFGYRPDRAIHIGMKCRIRGAELPLLGRIFRALDPSILTDGRVWTQDSLDYWRDRATLILSGFWQNQSTLFELHREAISRIFVPRCPRLRGMTLQPTGCAAAHVRRGDYVTNPSAASHHGGLDVDYYRRAIDEIRRGHALKCIDVYSDDPAWCARHLKLQVPWKVVPSSTDPLDDLWAMSKYEYLITANSSYSWWAGWLGNGVVVAPRQWSLAGSDVFIPSGWLRV